MSTGVDRAAPRRLVGPWAEPCPSCDGSGEIHSAKDRASCADCEGTGMLIPPALEATIAQASRGLAPDERIVESLEVLVGQQAWRVELIRGAGGESLRFWAFEPATGDPAPLVVDEGLAPQLQRVAAAGSGGIRRMLDGMCRDWTRRGAR